MASRQLNLRFDEQQHDVVRRVVDRLRRDSGFLGALEAVLASDSDPAGDRQALDTLARLAQLEQRVDALEAARPTAQTRPARPSTAPPSSTSSDASNGASVPTGEWTFGDTSKRLTPAGREELLRRIRAGESDIAIGRAMGINRETVRRNRKELPPLLGGEDMG
jgi:DNA-binding NarL/FixJ family response regulator